MNLGSESETVEFKKSTGEHKEALQAISAMLNKHGRGELYFGVKDNGDVIGQDVSDATLRQVTSWVSDKIEPAVFPTVECLDADDGLRYIKIAFSGADAPYSADGRYFTRVGTSNKALSASELSAMVVKRERARSPWDSLPSGRPVSDADEQAVRDFVARGGRAGRVGGGFAGVEDTLTRLDLVAPDGSLRNAAVELFCEGSDTYPRMKLGLLGGNTKAKILDLRRESGTMLKLLDFAEYFVTSNIRREFVIGDPRDPGRGHPRGGCQRAVPPRLHHRHRRRGQRVHGHRPDREPGPVPRGRLAARAPRRYRERVRPPKPRDRAHPVPRRRHRAVRHGHTAHQGGLRGSRREVPLRADRQQHRRRLRASWVAESGLQENRGRQPTAPQRARTSSDGNCRRSGENHDLRPRAGVQCR